jgi:hypothetical protein
MRAAKEVLLEFSAHAQGLDHCQLAITDTIKDVSRILSGHTDVDLHSDAVYVRVAPSLGCGEVLRQNSEASKWDQNAPGDILREQARVKLAMRRPEPVKRDGGRDDDAFLRRRHAPTPTRQMRSQEL